MDYKVETGYQQEHLADQYQDRQGSTSSREGKAHCNAGIWSRMGTHCENLRKGTFWGCKGAFGIIDAVVLTLMCFGICRFAYGRR